MLFFRTILLWLAFLLLLIQNFIEFDLDNIYLGIVYRLLPTGLLLLWFGLSVFFREKLKINLAETPGFAVISIRILRPLASIFIVSGALFKILHWPYGNYMLIAGIGFMAVYSTFLSIYSFTGSDQNPEIIDDMNE